ncbi:MAG: queuosine precursor transporter [Bacillota bacterium]|nr:queuosine precursor transporter [Bacillota bacterium]
MSWASLTAYIISQHHDIWAFTFWKNKTQDRHLWIRNNLSTCVSQMIDTIRKITGESMEKEGMPVNHAN